MSGSERPPAETRDEAYAYEAAHPHRATAIGTLQLDYDEDGNTTRQCEGTNCSPGRAQTFAWDEEGRMEEATGKGRLVRFRYDADGQRMVKLAAGGPTFTFGHWWTMSGNSHATKPHGRRGGRGCDEPPDAVGCYGAPMTPARQLRFSYEDYLRALEGSDLKLEFCGGVIYAMAGAR